MRPPPGPYASGARTLLSLLSLAVVLAAPAALLATVGGPVPGDALTARISEDGVTGTRRVPAEFLIEFAGCLLWLAWAVTFAALLLEISGLLRRRTPRYVEALRPLQQFHRARIEQVKQGLRPRERHHRAPTAEELLRRASVPIYGELAASEVAAPDGSSIAYEVTGAYSADGYRLERETLWSIARDQLGDPQRWREIAELNRALLESHGRSVADPGWPEPGWVLLLPGDARV